MLCASHDLHLFLHYEKKHKLTLGAPHQELFFDGAPDFVEAQYRSTRDAKCTNPFSEWLWGGMQYQLEHHLFPTMPRYKYPALQAAVKKFGKENNLDFRCVLVCDLCCESHYFMCDDTYQKGGHHSPFACHRAFCIKE